jgi:TRAP-type C4-dicarboxylate transport system permease small subunit
MMQALTDRLTRALTWIGGAALILMMIHVAGDVIFKYLFNMPIPGTAEVVAAYYMIGVVFLPLAWIETHNRPIVVELFYDRMPPWAKLPLDVLGTAASMTFYSFLLWQSIKIALESFERGEYVDGMWQVVVWPSRFLIPLGLAVALLVLALRLLRTLRGQPPGYGRADPI